MADDQEIKLVENYIKYRDTNLPQKPHIPYRFCRKHGRCGASKHCAASHSTTAKTGGPPQLLFDVLQEPSGSRGPTTTCFDIS